MARVHKTFAIDRGADVNKTAVDGSTALHSASLNGNLSIVTLLLDRGADPNKEQMGTNATPLTVAIQESLKHGRDVTRYKICRDITTLLLNSGADPNKAITATDATILLVTAVKDCRTKLVELLLKHGADANKENASTGETPLIVASQDGLIESVRLLLDRGADPNKASTASGKTPLSVITTKTTWKSHFDVTTLLLDRGADPNKAITGTNSSPLLVTAVEERRIKLVELLLKHGADANKENAWTGETPLNVASSYGHLEHVRLLLDRGADPNKENAVHGSTPLTITTFKGHLDITTLLLDRGADLNKPNAITGKTPLNVASSYGHLEHVRLLLDRGADPNQCEQSGDTPLHLAIYNGSTDIMKMLLYRGADPMKPRTKDGCHQIHIAASGGHMRATQLLAAFGADLVAKSINGNTARTMANRTTHLTIINFLDAVVGWPAFKIAVICRLHSTAKFALKHGLIDPSFCTVAELAVASSAPADALWPGSLAPCLLTTDLIKQVMKRWSPARHFLHHAGVRRSITTVLLLAERFRRTQANDVSLGSIRQLNRGVKAKAALSPLPGELWLFICSFFGRSDWEAVPALRA